MNSIYIYIYITYIYIYIQTISRYIVSSCYVSLVSIHNCKLYRDPSKSKGQCLEVILRFRRKWYRKDYVQNGWDYVLGILSLAISENYIYTLVLLEAIFCICVYY